MIGTQVIEDLMLPVYKSLIKAYRNRSLDDVTSHGERISDMLFDMDMLLATDPSSLLGNWLESAKSYGDTDAEKALMEFNARNQITLWGPDGQIEDYANKNWAGLVKNYYAQRWVLFKRELVICINDQRSYYDPTFRKKLMVLEKAWGRDRTEFPTTPIGDPLAIAEQLVGKYDAVYQLYAQDAEQVWALGRERTEFFASLGYLGAIEWRKEERRKRRAERAEKRCLLYTSPSPRDS